MRHCSVKAQCGWPGTAGPDELLAKYARPVPRYTSYPTAVQFKPDVDAGTYAEWLAGTDSHAAISLYLHIPFCTELCWYCGCHTAVARSETPIDDYVETLLAEIDLVSRVIGGRRRVSALHFGGGSPNILKPHHLEHLIARLHQHFDFNHDLEFAAELDPRGTSDAWIRKAASLGLNRASLGVQTFETGVQAMINRRQSLGMVRRLVETLRDAGIEGINFDLMYGLPRQTTKSVLDTIDEALDLVPDRIALFGYAHVPWMMARQRLIKDEDLPDSHQRLQQQLAASASLKAADYMPVGLDHFAKQGDDLAIAARNGTLRRNFQGYTTDAAQCLIGFGASSIGKSPQGFVQNKSDVPQWRAAIRSGQLATARGIALTDDDRRRASIIERLMCDLEADIGEFSRGDTADRLAEMEADGLIIREGERIAITEPGRPFLRSVCAVFDRYLPPVHGERRHAIAV
ncbi:MAG: oxygen-independent coproporphyrinogen III oxidase [Rhizobiales bacterium]|nr:oxygen-independent coproporphyrinogen III oxidase [Hyphomicrobiales bacterium]